ncbi:beta-propeller domain-containing protein [Bhargavaea ginsengi]|uniref:beta-propeller domain-containing protein n=1 Tax=Bhargavaea ginsengi TaxID=426757 RepID=UPI003C75A017
MQKGKKAIWLGLAALLVIAGIAAINAASRETPEVHADASVVSGDLWRAAFTADLAQDAADSGALKLTDEEGNSADAEMKLTGRQLEVGGLVPGRYILHVSGKAFGKMSQSGEEKIPFTVREDIAPVGSLEELEEHFQKIAARQEREMELYRESNPGEETATTEDSAAGPAGGAGHSMTNNQVSGVDEGDIVKTDGDYLYSTADGMPVKVYDIRKGGKPEHIATLQGEEGLQPIELYLSGDILAVIGNRFQYDPEHRKAGGPADIMPTGSAVTLRLYDVSNPAEPRLVREAGNEGWHVSSRLNGNILYLITSMTPFYRGMENEGDIRPYRYDSANKDSDGPMDTDLITILPGPAGDSYTIITAIDLDGGPDASIESEGFIGSGGGVYMSTENLYLASSEHQAQLFQEDGLKATGSKTKIFKYALDGTNVTFAASGEVPGTPLNQFSMDEHEGHFRIAVTNGNMWDERSPSESAVYVLDPELNETGSVTGLAKGERIYSARFMGDRAYVVTFRETDPLFAIDLSDPAAPAVLGELKIPGFSNYLHPLGDRHLIGFGQEIVSVKGDGPEPRLLNAGMKISLFDVSDMTSPKEIAVEIIGGRGTESELQYDHKALFEHRELGLYGFPVYLYEGSAENEEVRYEGSGAMIYEITPETGIRLKANFVSDKGVAQGYPVYEERILRVLYSGNTAFTVSPEEVTAYSLDDFSRLGSSAE